MRSRNAVSLGRVPSSPARACGPFERKAYLDVGSGEVAAGEPGALRKLRFHVVEVQLDLRLDERALRAARESRARSA
jgi:hypothetical protein